MEWTALDLERLPPLKPKTQGGKIAISCHKDREFLIRAWTVSWASPKVLVNWILHYIGRMNMNELEWWGYTYPGQPAYMRESTDTYTSGLTIQYFVEPTESWTKRALDEGKIGPSYGRPVDLIIPEPGHVQKVRGS